jgi:hypothetical protein
MVIAPFLTYEVFMIDKATKLDAKKQLLELLKEDDTIFMILKNVSSSGMYRHIDFFKFNVDKKRINKLWLSRLICNCLDYPYKTKTESVGVSGCGMDMGFSVVSALASELFGDYKKLKYEWL